MFKARIADFNILFDEYYNLLYLHNSDFSYDFEKPDIFIKTTIDDIERETKISDIVRRPYRMEEQCAFRKLAEKLPLYESCVLHSCFISVKGRGIAFSAKSGTGKTTHMKLWKQLLGDELEVINGDKPIIRFLDGNPYGYGTPWMGKEGIGCNGNAKLTDICLIERYSVNETVPISKEEGIILLMEQVYMPNSPAALAETIRIIGKITEKCNFWRIRCNMDIEAADVAYKTIFNII